MMPVFKNTEDRNEQRRKNYRKGKVHDYRSGAPWTQEEVKWLHDRVYRARGFTDRDLALELCRSVQAIQVKRWKTKGVFR